LKIRKYLPYLAGVIIFVVCLTIYLSRQELFKKKPDEYLGLELAHNFSLKSLNGEIISLSDFKGKVVILDFWATWCPPCREEIPHFINLYEKYKNKGFQMLGVILDQNKDAVESFSKEYNINYPLLTPDKKILKDYGPITYIPTTFIISKKGYVYKKYVGYNSESVFENDLKTLF